jgi:uncharacterized protein (DUF1800 family)
MKLSRHVLVLLLLPFVSSVLSWAATPVSVSLGVTSLTLTVGTSKTFTASVANSSNKALNWSVSPASSGSIDSTGKYTAPASLPANGNQVTVTATSVADPTKSASAAVVLINVVPTIKSLSTERINSQVPFSITITGAGFVPTATVTLTDGTPVTVTLVRRIPETEVTITGTSQSPAGTQISLTVTNPSPGGAVAAVDGATVSSPRTLAVAAPVTVTVYPATKTIAGGSALTLEAVVGNTSNANVTWKVNGVTNGNATVGVLTPEKTPAAKPPYTASYAAPWQIPSGGAVTITATSAADPTKSGSAVITIQNPVPVVTSVTSPVTTGVVALSISGTGFEPQATVALGTTNLTVTWKSTTSLTATATVTPPVGGVLALTVTNPSPGGGASNVVPVTVNNPAGQLSYAAARRFLEQATWGPTPASIANLQSIGITAWLAAQFATPASQYTLPVDATEDFSVLQDQFFGFAANGPDQLRQRVAFALSQILVTSGLKVNTYAEMMPYQQLLLNDAFGQYKAVFKDVTLSPTMGHYLDMVNNGPPTATSSPDENYARESMQLMTIGLTNLNGDGSADNPPINTFSDTDVRALAGVYTGWTYPTCTGQPKWPNPPCFVGAMIPFESEHYNNPGASVLGTTINTGSAEGDLDAAINLLDTYTKPHPSITVNGKGVPNIAPFISLRLIQHLVKSNPSPAYIQRVATVFFQTDGNLQAVVTAILTDPENVPQTNCSAATPCTDGHLREPALLIAALLRALNAQYVYDPPLNPSAAAMGQDIYDAASVFNYYSPFYHAPGTPLLGPEFQILNQASSFARANYVYLAIRNQISSDIAVDLTNFEELASDTNAATETASLTTMLNAVSRALLGGPMPSGMLNAILPDLLATKSAKTRALDAVYLTAVSSGYQVVR